MANLHDALKSLAPIKFSDLPTEEPELEPWLSDVFSQSQVILDSIPIADPPVPSTEPRASSSSLASDASEIVLSSARPPLPIPEHLKLQKEWGKSMKLGAKENPLGMSVYKLGGKDGRGAWFARRSVHEGIPFSRFKKALQQEFLESLAVQGAPGEGNIRGIGSEARVADVNVPSKGKVEVYRLSAQFPGPTTPRDFVTMLITSDNAMQAATETDPVLKHYLIVSKPCDHPDTQPQSGFIRGYYESVEFIREIPRLSKPSRSTTNLPELASQDENQRNVTTKPTQSDDALRERSTTLPGRPHRLDDDEEHNPVEWIMVTRSDPGGSVPRFMVERGTPGSICADAEKFLNWACRQNFDVGEVDDTKDLAQRRSTFRRDSFKSFRSSRMVGVGEVEMAQNNVARDRAAGKNEGAGSVTETEQNQQPSGWGGAVSSATQFISSYTPQVVLNQLPGNNSIGPELSKESSHPGQEDDAISEASFESADSHIPSGPSEPASPASSKVVAPHHSDEHLNQHEKELRKLEHRREALQNKFTESRERLKKEATEQTAKEEVAKQKATEKHDKEMKRQHEKYEKELKKIEERQVKEKKKLEDRLRKQNEKDERIKLTRERDEARQELGLLKKETDTLKHLVEDLRKENAALVTRLGKNALPGELSGSGDESHSLSRHNSHKRSKERSRAGTDSGGTSIKSH